MKFRGLAPIPTGTIVTMLVDDPDNPSMAYSVTDDGRRIEFTSSEPLKPMSRGFANTVTAQVDSVKVHIIESVTELYVTNVKPKQ